MLYITDNAQKYFIKLLSKQKEGTQIRIFIKKMSTSYTEFAIRYYFPDPDRVNDIKIKFDLFSIYLEQSIVPLITGAKIDIVSDKLETKLSIKIPNLNNSINNNNNNTINNTNNTSSLEDRINHVLEFQINPQLAMHGGSVSLIKITQDSLAILQFHGGCNGCEMAYYTVQKGIENTLKKIFPELKGVIDGTHHQHGTHSYY